MEKKEKENIIKIEVKALSNLFIGGTPRPFEIGGIDQWTAVDEYGFPCIPASSLKGALRAIVAEDRSPVALEIAQWYEEMLKAEMTQIREKFKGNAEMVDRIERRYQEVLKQSSAVYLFGIREFNNTPKLLFNDLRLKKEYQDLDSCFSIDTKTAIDSINSKPVSNPRTYKAVKKGMEFEGEIEFYRFDGGEFDEDKMRKCQEYIIYNLYKFNEGIYRLGNSKSRGYGKIHVSAIGGNGKSI